MSTSPVNYPEVIRFYERVTRLKPASFADRGQNTGSDLLNISAEAKKKFVLKLAFNEVLEKIKK
jgi:hypothetical protein